MPGRRAEEGERRRGEMPLPSDQEGTMLCVVTRIVGGGFLEVRCSDGEVYKAWIPGKMRRKVWMREGDVILFLPWGTRDMKGEVVYRYEREEVKKLVDMGLLDRDMLEGAGEEFG